MNKSPVLAVCVLAAISYGSTAAANFISDTYHGGNGHGYGDVIGNTALFQIAGAEISLNGSVMTVDIFTNLAGRADEGLFAAYTNTPFGQGRGIGYGDVFLADHWSPFGTGPYANDNHANGTLWQYGFSIDGDRWSDAGGTGTLYRLNGQSNNANALLTDDFMSGAIFRNGQEVAVDRAADVTAVATGSWSVTPGPLGTGRISYTFDIVGTSLWDPRGSMDFGLHWAMGCGNDTIEGETSFDRPPPGATTVAEPVTAALMLAGLAGLGARRRA